VNDWIRKTVSCLAVKKGSEEGKRKRGRPRRGGGEILLTRRWDINILKRRRVATPALGGEKIRRPEYDRASVQLLERNISKEKDIGGE